MIYDPFLGHMHTVQTKNRCHRMRRLTRIYTDCIQEFKSIRNTSKVKMNTREWTPDSPGFNSKWTRPVVRIGVSVELGNLHEEIHWVPFFVSFVFLFFFISFFFLPFFLSFFHSFFHSLFQILLSKKQLKSLFQCRTFQPKTRSSLATQYRGN